MDVLDQHIEHRTAHCPRPGRRAKSRRVGCFYTPQIKKVQIVSTNLASTACQILPFLADFSDARRRHGTLLSSYIRLSCCTWVYAEIHLTSLRDWCASLLRPDRTSHRHFARMGRIDRTSADKHLTRSLRSVAIRGISLLPRTSTCEAPPQQRANAAAPNNHLQSRNLRQQHSPRPIAPWRDRRLASEWSKRHVDRGVGVLPTPEAVSMPLLCCHLHGDGGSGQQPPRGCANDVARRSRSNRPSQSKHNLMPPALLSKAAERLLSRSNRGESAVRASQAYRLFNGCSMKHR